jgi:hypothetical protein
MKRFIIVLILCLSVVGTAQAHGVGARMTFAHHRVLTHTAIKHVPSLMAVAQSQACLDNDQFDLPFVQAHNGNVFRVVITDSQIGQGVDCIRQAEADGYRVYISFQYWYTATPQALADMMRQLLTTYPNLWAVSIGNEEDLDQVTPAQYLTDWNTVAPVVAQMQPQAIRVYGESSPWGQSWMQQTTQTRPVDAQAISTHCYDTPQANTGMRGVPAVNHWMAKFKLPLWCSEMSPQTMPIYSFFAVDTMASYDSKIAYMETHAPNLTMLAYWHWPQMGAN